MQHRNCDEWATDNGRRLMHTIGDDQVCIDILTCNRDEALELRAALNDWLGCSSLYGYEDEAIEEIASNRLLLRRLVNRLNQDSDDSGFQYFINDRAALDRHVIVPEPNTMGEPE